MPRERVKHGSLTVWSNMHLPGEDSIVDNYIPGMDVPEGSEVRENPSLDVLWNRDAEWVQLGFNAPRDWWDRFIASHANDGETVTDYAIYTDILNRKEINDLIRVLRRARDSAYGSDE